MDPARADLRAGANGYDEREITIPGFASAVGVSARMDFRAGQTDDSTLYLSLTSTPAAGLTLSSDGTNLVIAFEITETQMDTLVTALRAAGVSACYYSLKITPSNGKTRPYIYGTYTVTLVPTP